MQNSILSKDQVNKLVLEQCLNFETALMYVEVEDEVATIWFPEIVQNDPELVKRFSTEAGILEPAKSLCVLTEDPNPEVLISDPNAVPFLTGSVVTGPRAYTTWIPAPNVLADSDLISQLEKDYEIEVNLESEGFAASRAGLPIFHFKNRGELVALLALTAKNSDVQGNLTTQDWVGQMLESFSQTA
jgi:hypothetical protein